MAGRNSNTHISDGICPKGYNYDVKSSKFYIGENRWHFKLYNINKEIVYLYLLAFNEDFTELTFSWRIPIYKSFSENRKILHIYSKDRHYRGPTKYNIKNMKQYEITDKIRPIFEKWLEKVKKQDNSKEAIVREARERLKVILENKKKDQIFKRDYDINYDKEILKIPSIN